MYEFVCIANLQRKYHRICLYNNRAVEMCTYLSVCFNIEEEMSVYLTESLCLSVCMSVCLYVGPFFLLFFLQQSSTNVVVVGGQQPAQTVIVERWVYYRPSYLRSYLGVWSLPCETKKSMLAGKHNEIWARKTYNTSYFPACPPKGGRGCLKSPPCLKSQGCHLIPLCYLLSCSSA